MERSFRWAMASVLSLTMVIVGWLPASASPPLSEPPYQRRDAVVLVESSEPGKGFVRYNALMATLLRHFFDVRALTGTRSEGFMSLRNITGEGLQGADLFVLEGFDGTFGMGTKEGGSQEVDNNLRPSEMDALEGWVREGGALVVIGRPMGRYDQTNLPELLARFGLIYRHDSKEVASHKNLFEAWCQQPFRGNYHGPRNALNGAKYIFKHASIPPKVWKRSILW